MICFVPSVFCFLVLASVYLTLVLLDKWRIHQLFHTVGADAILSYLEAAGLFASSDDF